MMIMNYDVVCWLGWVGLGWAVCGLSLFVCLFICLFVCFVLFCLGSGLKLGLGLGLGFWDWVFAFRREVYGVWCKVRGRGRGIF